MSGNDPCSAAVQAAVKAANRRSDATIAGMATAHDLVVDQLRTTLDTLALAQKVMRDQTATIARQATRIKELEGKE